LRVLIVPGLHGSGPDHWQTRWQQLYPSFERVEQAKWNTPELPVWSERLDEVLHTSNRPTVIVAHSFGCLTSVHRAGRLASNRLAGMLLVAPADPDKFGLTKELLDVKLPCPSIVVGSSNDPWMEAHQAAYWAQVWGSEFINAGALGHVNSESGLGDWLFGLSLLQRLAVTANAQLSVPAL
jgi:predicted alpha/beta hydrolase family esterase